MAERQAAEAAAAEGIEIDAARSLLNYAEAPHAGDWTLRSASVRLAQRDPARVGSLLQVMRRLDAPLHHVARALQANPAVCDEAMGDRGWSPDESLDGSPASPTGDIRTADLARLVAAGFDEAEVMAGYQAVIALEREEQLAVPLLAVAADFERLARDLATWADGDLSEPPLDAVDRLTVEAAGRLDALGVPEETGPPRGGRSRG